jgi:hypothetical protein
MDRFSVSMRRHPGATVLDVVCLLSAAVVHTPATDFVVRAARRVRIHRMLRHARSESQARTA